MGSAKAQSYKETPAWQRARASWLGALTRVCKSCGHEFAAWARKSKQVDPDVARLTESLRLLDGLRSRQVWAAEAQDSESPIFLLSTGWRAGSTLLQRILLTDPNLLLWGEPLGEMTFVSRMTDMISDFISPRNLELWKNQLDAASAELSTSWIANLYPSCDEFRLGMRSLFDQWLAQPARARGFTRWGFKEVRLGAVEAILLRWLYPNARFVIISRHPYACYRSLSDSRWDEVYYRYPDIAVDSAAGFARQWSRLGVSWAQLPENFPYVHIKYEDLIAGKVDFRKLESWLGIEIKEGIALKASVGGTAKRDCLRWYERLIIAREARAGMRALGYDSDQGTQTECKLSEVQAPLLR
jgi:Sulfotransferase family